MLSAWNTLIQLPELLKKYICLGCDSEPQLQKILIISLVCR